MVVALLVVVAACSDDDEPDRITRIDGPAQVDDENPPRQSPDE